MSTIDKLDPEGLLRRKRVHFVTVPSQRSWVGLANSLQERLVRHRCRQTTNPLHWPPSNGGTSVSLLGYEAQHYNFEGERSHPRGRRAPVVDLVAYMIMKNVIDVVLLEKELSQYNRLESITGTTV